jgi:hypothetical protein
MESNTFYILSCGFAFFTLIFAFSFTQYAIRNTHNEIVPTTVERALQIHPFLCKTNPISKKSSERILFINKGIRTFGHLVKWEKRTQNEPNSNPIQTQNKPKQSQFPNSSRARFIYFAYSLTGFIMFTAQIYPSTLPKWHNIRTIGI